MWRVRWNGEDSMEGKRLILMTDFLFEEWLSESARMRGLSFEVTYGNPLGEDELMRSAGRIYVPTIKEVADEDTRNRVKVLD